MKLLHLIALFIMLALSSCANKGQTTAAATGAAGTATPTGPTIGHHIEATFAGASTGGILGNIVDNAMDKYDREQLNHTFERGISNQRTSWVNPDKGALYTVTPQPAYQNAATNRACRKAEIEAVLSGKPQRSFGTACRNASSGSWELQQ